MTRLFKLILCFISECSVPAMFTRFKDHTVFDEGRNEEYLGDFSDELGLLGLHDLCREKHNTQTRLFANTASLKKKSVNETSNCRGQTKQSGLE